MKITLLDAAMMIMVPLCVWALVSKVRKISYFQKRRERKRMDREREEQRRADDAELERLLSKLMHIELDRVERQLKLGDHQLSPHRIN